MTRQIPLFANDPQSIRDIDGRSALPATFALFAEGLRADGKSPHTVKAFLGDLRLLAEFTGDELPIGELRRTHLVGFLEWMERDRGVPCSRKTYARRVTSLKVFCKWLHGLEALAEDPARSIRQRSGPAPLSDVLTEAQVRACVVAASELKRGASQDYRPAWLFRLLLEAGVKKAECGRLRLRDIERGKDGGATLYIRHKARDIYKERRIALEEDAASLLDRYLRQYQVTDKLFDCTTRNLEYILTDIGERAGAPFKLSFEVMRWTMAARECVAGVDEARIREKLGLSRRSWYETGDKIRRLAVKIQAGP